MDLVVQAELAVNWWVWHGVLHLTTQQWSSNGVVKFIRQAMDKGRIGGNIFYNQSQGSKKRVCTTALR